MNEFTIEQRALLEEIWRISEEGWHAGWMADIEFQLWTIIKNGPAMCGQLKIDSTSIENLKRLTKEARGWFYWDKTEQEKWIDIGSWEKMYQAKMDSISHQ